MKHNCQVCCYKLEEITSAKELLDLNVWKGTKTEKNLQKKWKSLPYLLRVERKEVGVLLFSSFSSHRCVFLFDILSSVFLSEYSGLPKDSQLDWQTLYFRELKCLALWRISSGCEGVVLQNSYPAYSSSVTFACHSKVITDLKNSSPQQISPEDVSITSSNRGKKTNILSTTEN